jgi:hypothetical protein
MKETLVLVSILEWGVDAFVVDSVLDRQKQFLRKTRNILDLPWIPAFVDAV